VPGSIGLEQLGNIRHQWIIGIRIGQQGADGEQHLADGERGAPLILEDVETNTAVGIDVAVVNSRGEVDLGWLEGIVGREVNVQEEDTSRVRRIIGSHDGCLPVEHVVTDRSGGAVGRRIFSQVHQFYFLFSSCCIGV